MCLSHRRTQWPAALALVHDHDQVAIVRWQDLHHVRAGHGRVVRIVCLATRGVAFTNPFRAFAACFDWHVAAWGVLGGRGVRGLAGFLRIRSRARCIARRPRDETSQITLWAFSGLFLFLSLFGLLTLLQLIRLRGAWFESVKAMNQIKDAIIENATDTPLEKAFRWRTSTLPIAYKPWSVAFLLAFQVSLLGTATFGASIYYGSLALNRLSPISAIVGGIIFLILQQYLYKKLLK